MVSYERSGADSPDVQASAARLGHARRWLRAADGAPGSVTPELLRDALADHTGAPDSLCRHEREGSHTKTVFWCLVDVTDGVIRFGRGNPCDSQEQVHVFS
jgi:hypothetical protein